MRYFLIHTDDQFTTAPNILNWYEKINKHWIKIGDSFRLPQRELLMIESNPATVFTDILSFPFFLVTKKVRKVMEMYAPTTVYKDIVLLDSVNKLVEVYYLPILEHVSCLAKESVLSPDRSIIKSAVIDTSKVGDRSIFFIDDVRNTYVVARLDIVESFLRRGARGIGLTLAKTK